MPFQIALASDVQSFGTCVQTNQQIQITGASLGSKDALQALSAWTTVGLGSKASVNVGHSQRIVLIWKLNPF